MMFGESRVAEHSLSGPTPTLPAISKFGQAIRDWRKRRQSGQASSNGSGCNERTGTIAANYVLQRPKNMADWQSLFTIKFRRANCGAASRV